jgi:hypothetical protein
MDSSAFDMLAYLQNFFANVFNFWIRGLVALISSSYWLDHPKYFLLPY